jgi:uncharacterized membrane protein YhaH (DUF805 family)
MTSALGLIALLAAGGFWLAISLAAGASTIPRVTWRDLWTVDGEIDRAPYFAVGFTLMAVKYNLERLVAGVFFHRSWSVLAQYLHAPQLDPQSYLGDDRRFYSMIVLMSMPFIWTGVALTVRRLRSAGLPIGLFVLFFAPILNLFFFLLMAALPRANGPERASSFADRMIPRSQGGSAIFVVLVGGALTLGLTEFSSALLKGYGWGLFIGLPFVLGLSSTLVYGHHQPRSLAECVSVASLTVAFAGVVLFAAAVEGAICLAMAAPLALALAAMGAALGYLIQRRPRPAGHLAALALVLFGVPVLMGAERADGIVEPVLPVVTSIDIDAPAETVWRNVVTFSELPAPTHWIFRLGFAYPTRATIVGRGVGAVRHCEFTTGPFVEPITVWDEPRLLKFSVTSQPAPMKETSWYPDLHPAYLDDYLISKGGQFRLEPLAGGGTRLTGTTWYSHAIRPGWYWRPMSDWIIHRIHDRVLTHIKSLSEAKA